jgi:signal transduction histidine kinase/ActR/RegA family two-component response regulator
MPDSPTSQPNLSRSVTGTLIAFALIGALLIATGDKDYPELHAILDTGGFLLSGLLASLFWDMGVRLDRPLPKRIAVSFAVTSLLELIHILVAVEWSGVLAPIAQAEHLLRPSTWPPAAYLLPVGITSAVLLARPGQPHLAAFTSVLLALGAGLIALFHWLPKYGPPGWLGISRSTLLFVPLLWVLAGWLCWRQRAEERALPLLALMAVVLFPAHLAMLYSHAPNDAPAMVAHFGKICGYLFMLLTLMHMASTDMLERIRAERALAQLNDELERRVVERTAQLESANGLLEVEIGVRRQAEQKAHAQLERLNLLHQITRAIGERQDLKSIFQVVVRSVEEHLPVDFGCICLHEQGQNWLSVAHVGVGSEALALSLALTAQARVAIDANGLSHCLRGQLVYEPDVAEVPMPFAQRLAQGGLRAVVMAPLLVESQVFGLLLAGRRQPQSFASGECEFLRQLSEHVALAAHQAQLHGALQRAYDDLRQTQQAAMQQERLRALGQMASGIAHDINNAISPVAIYTESLLETEANLSERARQCLETIQRAIDDVAKTVSRMREFYRPHEPQSTLARVRLDTLAQQVIDLTRARWSDMPQQRGCVIRMVTDFSPDLPDTMGVESEIREALINLVFNAVDAMPEGGILTVRTRAVQGRPEPSGAPMPRQVWVEIGDTGVGMDEGTRRRCLEPFFTTKGERGTGLGLAMVYGVVQRHGAEIEIDSEPGNGTKVRLVFPVSEVLAGLVQPAPPAAAPPRQRILIVDDDPLVLKSLRDTLETDGHRVVAANGGEAGIEAFQSAQQRGEPFGVVITDLGMPHIDGRRVAGAVKAASPSTPVILLTGWGQRLADNGDQPANVNRVLSKPPKLRELREALAACCHEVAS